MAEGDSDYKPGGGRVPSSSREQTGHQPGMVASPARGQLNRENDLPPYPFAPDRLVSQKNVCETCHAVAKGEDPEAFLMCTTCQKYCCESCLNKCNDPYCEPVIACQSCSTMISCSQCPGVFCSKEADDEDLTCGARCVCTKPLCTNCSEWCTLCEVAVCKLCVRVCFKCDDIFCRNCDRFLVTCEFCDKSYCLICGANKTSCNGCGKAPTPSRVKKVTSQLMKVQEHLKSGQRGVPAFLGLSVGGTCDEKTYVAEKLKEKIGDASQEIREKEKTLKMKVKAEAEKKRAEEQAKANASAARDVATKQSKKSKKKKKKSKNSAATKDATAGAAAAAAAAVTSLNSASSTTVAAASAEPTRHSYDHHEMTMDDSVPLKPKVDNLVIDHSIIKTWVVSIAALETVATAADIQRYFHGRVDSVVIDSVLENFNNNCRETVIQCAEFLGIFIPPGLNTMEKRKDEAKNQMIQHHQIDQLDADEERKAESVQPEEDFDDEQQLVTGVFAARERVKQGDFDFAEHPLERRANAAMHSGCKDLKVLQAILDEAKGQPGLARPRKMISKMLKKIKAEQEEIKLKRERQKAIAKKEVSQKLHPAYAQSREPAYSSFRPANIPANKPPDKLLDVPQEVVGWVIGKNGIRIIELQERSGASMWIDQNFPDGEVRKLHIHGTKAEVESAVYYVTVLMSSAPANNQPKIQVKAPPALPPGHPDLLPPKPAKTRTTRVMDCPPALVGFLIGRRGIHITEIKDKSNANVEVRHGRVFITGSQECVNLAAILVEEMIALGKEASLANPSTSMMPGEGPAMSNAVLPGSGPVLAFSSAAAQDSVDAITHDFGDLGGLGNAAVAGVQNVDTQSAIDRLHQGVSSAQATNPFFSTTGGGIHNGYHAAPQEDGFHFHQWQQQVQQQQQHQPPLVLEQVPVQQHLLVPTSSLNCVTSPARGNSGGMVVEAGSEDVRVEETPPFGSVQALLDSVGFPHLLPNFLEHDFDVKAITLMTDKDFEVIKIPKGPQLKIQRACREAGIIPPAKSSNTPSSTAAIHTDEEEGCAICLERDIEVTFLPCGHQNCCKTCGDTQVGKPCPMCRIPVTEAVRFFSG